MGGDLDSTLPVDHATLMRMYAQCAETTRPPNDAVCSGAALNAILRQQGQPACATYDDDEVYRISWVGITRVIPDGE